MSRSCRNHQTSVYWLLMKLHRKVISAFRSLLQFCCYLPSVISVKLKRNSYLWNKLRGWRSLAMKINLWIKFTKQVSTSDWQNRNMKLIWCILKSVFYVGKGVGNMKNELKVWKRFPRRLSIDRESKIQVKLLSSVLSLALCLSFFLAGNNLRKVCLCIYFLRLYYWRLIIFLINFLYGKQFACYIATFTVHRPTTELQLNLSQKCRKARLV